MLLSWNIKKLNLKILIFGPFVHPMSWKIAQNQLNLSFLPYFTRNYQRDGPMNVNGNQEGAPNYFPNSFSGPNVDRRWKEHS